MDLDISFDGKAMCTPVYIQADAQEQLLLSEGVCRQLEILQYHPEVEPWRGGGPRNRASAGGSGLGHQGKGISEDTQPARDTGSPALERVEVPTVRILLVRSVHLLPHQGATVQVQIDSGDKLCQPESVFNPTGCSCSVEAGTMVGEACAVAVIEPSPCSSSWTACRRVISLPSGV